MPRSVLRRSSYCKELVNTTMCRLFECPWNPREPYTPLTATNEARGIIDRVNTSEAPGNLVEEVGLGGGGLEFVKSLNFLDVILSRLLRIAIVSREAVVSFHSFPDAKLTNVIL